MTGQLQRIEMGAARTCRSWVGLLALVVRKELPNGAALLANGFVLPVGICYLAFMLAPGDMASRRNWFVGGLIVALGMTCVTAIYSAVSSDRFLGVKRLVETLPVGRAAYIAAYLTYGTLFSVAICCLGAVSLRLFGLTAVSWQALPWLAVLALASGFSLSSLGVVIGISTPSIAVGDVIASVAGAMLSIANPVFFPPGYLPDWARAAAWISPYAQIASLATDIASGRAPSIAAAAALVCVGLVAVIVSAFLMRRAGR